MAPNRLGCIPLPRHFWCFALLFFMVGTNFLLIYFVAFLMVYVSEDSTPTLIIVVITVCTFITLLVGRGIYLLCKTFGYPDDEEMIELRNIHHNLYVAEERVPIVPKAATEERSSPLADTTL